MSAQHNKAATLGALEELNGPLEERMGYFELYAPGVVLHGYPFGITDRESLQAYYAEVWEARPDARLEIEDVVAGEKVVVRFTWHGTPAYCEPIAGEPADAALRRRQGRRALAGVVRARAARRPRVLTAGRRARRSAPRRAPGCGRARSVPA